MTRDCISTCDTLTHNQHWKSQHVLETESVFSKEGKRWNLFLTAQLLNRSFLHYVPSVSSCLTCLRTARLLSRSLLNYVSSVPSCFTCLRAFRAFAPYKPSCLCAFTSYVPPCLTCLRTLRALIFTRLNYLPCAPYLRSLLTRY